MNYVILQHSEYVLKKLKKKKKSKPAKQIDIRVQTMKRPLSFLLVFEYSISYTTVKFVICTNVLQDFIKPLPSWQ